MAEISIIVPVYNVGKYIRRCIDSLLIQTFKDIEILLIDDGSTDCSGTICDEYAAKDSRVKVIHKKNGGVSSARNVGLDNAIGVYIMFCDPDDYVDPTWCEKMYYAIESNGGHFACCGFRLVTVSCQVKMEKYIYISSLEIGNKLVELYAKNLLSSVCNKIYNLATIKENLIRFDETIQKAEDTIFTFQYLKTNVYSIGIVQEPVYDYIVDIPGSLTKKIVHEHWELTCRIFKEISSTFELYNVDFSEYSNVYYTKMITMILQTVNMLFCYDISSKELFSCGRAIFSSAECKNAFKYGCFVDVNPLYRTILQTRSFFLVWLFHCAVKLKHRLTD